MRHIENEIEKLVYYEYGYILDKKDEVLDAQEKLLKAHENLIKSPENLKTQTDLIKAKEKLIKTQENLIKIQTSEIKRLENINNEFKNKVKQLNELEDLTPEERKIISEMMLL
ncbi:hypothetical protein [Methanobrevibacter sp.]|uniref:hypothetical protein n=1 Tax=Methanobrevibacter sp. TaxID=66852 RepID=UPI00388EFF9F